MMRRAGVYLRISRDLEGTGAGVERQEEDCRALCAREGWGVAKVYTDNSVSAFSGKERPAFTRMLADAQDGAFDVLVAWHDDRLWRGVVEQQLTTAMLAEAGVALIATPNRTYRTDSVDDGFMVGMQALMAQYESAHSGVRKRRQKLQLAQQGRDNGGWRTFGYKADRVTVDPDEAAVLREGMAYLLAGGTVVGLCRRWDEQGVRTSKGQPWVPSVLKRLMTNPRLAGLRTHHGEVVGEAAWDPIFTVDEHERLVRELGRRERSRPGPVRRYLLTGGLAVCGRCGADLAAARRSNGTAAYKCFQSGGNHAGCGRIGVVAEPLEDHVWDLVLAALDGDGLARAIEAASGEDARRGQVAAELRQVQERLHDLDVAFYTDGVPARPAYLEARDQLQARERSLTHQLEGDDRLSVLASLPGDRGALAARWDEADVGWRRGLVSALVDRVTVLPANGRRLFSGERVAVDWRV